MPPADLLVSVDHPFPGLRPFETGESLLFFGREEHTQELLRRLAGGRFLAVVGTSGSGKSSLVRAGLLPALYRGYLAGSTTHWRIAVMRPGSAPLENLCAALADKDALGDGDRACRLELLQSSSLGLVEVVRGAKLEPGESLLIVADQFEELFRYQRQAVAGNGAADAASGAALFVSLLLQAAERFDSSVYVVLTMRSDYLGDCSQFPGLPEALSRSQYLIPRLTREQRQQAIERPLHLAGAGIATPLVQQLLNDSGDEAGLLGAGAIVRGGMPDPLPVLQHALMRTFEHWKKTGAQGDLDLQHYDRVGGIKDALNRHAESIYENLGASGQVWAAKLFRCLTATEAGRPVRRPTRLNRLYEIVGAASEADRREVDAVLRGFLGHENSLLVSSSPEGLKPEAVIDIPHESLIWKWDRLQGWVRKEAVSAEWYLDLVKDAGSFRKGESGLWRDPNLGHALEMKRTEGWNESWAAQYHPSADPSYADALGYLDQGRTVQRRERWVRWIGSGVAVVVLVALLFYWRRAQEEAERSRVLQGQVRDLKSQYDKAQSEARKYASEMAHTKALLAGVLSPEERSKLEKQFQEAKAKADQAQKIADVAEMQRRKAVEMAARGADLNEVNKALQERVNQSEARVKALEKKLVDAQSLINTYQDSSDTAARVIGRQKLQLEEATKEREALTKPQLVAATTLKPGTVRRSSLDGLDYVWIPPGEFQMGCSAGDNECADDEKPLHPVKISNGFWMGQTEVTESAYVKLMGGNPSGFKGPQLPMERVYFDKAAQYCKAAGGRLPTEAEWEYAARAGSTAPRYGELDAIAWYARNSKSTTHPVKQKMPNAWGLYDMLGNVPEWVADWYLDTYYGTLPSLATDPKGPRSESYHVSRGGSWGSSPRDARVSKRAAGGALGFRCARK